MVKGGRVGSAVFDVRFFGKTSVRCALFFGVLSACSVLLWFLVML